jgi:uncharacterized phage protein (TIGR02218 family)
MRVLTAALAQRFALDLATSAICWKITMTNGQILAGTEHDQDVTISVNLIPGLSLAGLYQAATGIGGSDVKTTGDMSIDNMEVTGAFQENLNITDVTVEDLEAGLLDGAVVIVFVVDWSEPDIGAYVLQYGTTGDITRTSDGQYKTEIRGLTQALTQNIVGTYGDHCNVVRFGDARCKKDVASITIVATVTAVVDRKHFTVSGITVQPVGYFSYGILRGLTGANAGFERNIKLDSFGGAQGQLDLWYAMPYDVVDGDTFAMEPGCDRTATTCRDVHDNFINNRAYGIFIPGVLAMLEGPGKIP